MKKQKINIVAYSEKDNDQWFSCDKKEFEQIISANTLLAKENEKLKHQLAEKDKEIERIQHQTIEFIKYKIANINGISLETYSTMCVFLDQIEGEKK